MLCCLNGFKTESFPSIRYFYYLRQISTIHVKYIIIESKDCILDVYLSMSVVNWLTSSRSGPIIFSLSEDTLASVLFSFAQTS